MSKKPKSTARDGFGILNPYGDLWTTDIFRTEDQAHQHVRDFWKDIKLDKPFKYRVVRVRQRTSYKGEVALQGGE